MMIDVHLFARARDVAGAPRLSLDLPEMSTVGALRRRLREVFPGLASLLDHSALAVNNEFAGDDVVLAPGAEVALLPPVSGG
jgi:molybdopterin converting factor subunit 1